MDNKSDVRADIGVINVTYHGPLNAFLDEALSAALQPLGYHWSESGLDFETNVRDIRFRLEEEKDEHVYKTS